jgi:hypothetical protein
MITSWKTKQFIAPIFLLMKGTSPGALLMSFMILMSSGCNNENELRTDLMPACFLLKENVLGDSRHKLFKYNSGNPTHIADMRQADDTFDVTKVYTGKIIKTNVDKTYPTYLSTLIQYDANILSQSPSVAHFSYTLKGVTTDDKTLHFRYDRNGRMIEFTRRSKLNAASDFIATIDYDENENVRQLQYTYPAYSETITVIASGYDSKFTPYARIRGWKFISSGDIWNPANPYASLAALSQNNPRGYVYLVNKKETYAITYQYLYNEQGFPTQRDQVYMTETSNTHATYLYEYLCP